MKKNITLLLLSIIFAVIAAIIVIPRAINNKGKSTPTTISSNKSTKTQKDVRKPAVAGSFYPDNSQELETQLDALLEGSEKKDKEGKLRILIVPHAGINYSGQAAAKGFKQLEGSSYSRVILLGSSHKVALKHAAVFSKGAWKTPLGTTLIDEAGASYLISNEQQIIADDNPHLNEHSLEMELIYLQKVLSDFKIIPILVGQSNESLVESLAKKISYLFDDDTLLVISSDLSHYPTWGGANEVDKQTIGAILTGEKSIFEAKITEIESKNFPNLSTAACASESIKIGLKVAEYLSIDNFELIDYTNSGDITGEKDRVVGYASIGGWRNKLSFPEFDEKSKTEALEIARQTLINFLKNQKINEVIPKSEILYRPLGAFVTLRNKETLRGCLGMFEPDIPLYQVIQDRTIAAASKDKRFSPVKENELENIEIEISVLTPRKRISNWQEIETGKHGVVIQKGSKAGTFLPQVATDNNWSLETFLSELCLQKTKLPANCYQDPNVGIYTFEALVFGE